MSEIVKLPGDDSQVVMADDRKKIYRLRVSEQIRELGAVDLAEPLLGRWLLWVTKSWHLSVVPQPTF